MGLLSEQNDGGVKNQILAVFAASIAMFTSGVHMAWSGPSLPKILSEEYVFDVTESDASYVAIIGTLGDVVGGFAASFLLDRIGRQKTILLLTVPQTLSFLATYFSYLAKWLLFTSRIIGGVGSGAALALLPVYLAEVSTPKIRGALGTSLSVTWALGSLFINLIGSFVDIHTASLICLGLPMGFFLVFFSMPETPYYLLMIKDEERARSALRILLRSDNFDKEMALLKSDVARQMSESGTYRDLFTIKSNRRAFITVSLGRFFQQFTGCTAFVLYYQILLAEATDVSPVIGSSVLFIIQMTTAVISSFVVDKFGRRPLFITSTAATCLVLFAMATYFVMRDTYHVDVTQFAWLPLLLMALFTICFISGIGVGMNVIISEIYSTSIKSKALSLGCVIFAVTMSSSTKFYQLTGDNFGLAVPFYSFAISTFIGLLYFIFFLPETKGKTLEEIQQQLKGKQ